MGILFIIFVVICILLYVNVWVLYDLCERRVSLRWWLLLLLMWTAGTGCGVYGAIFFEYQPSPTLRVIGAPIPGALFRLEGPPGAQQWADYVFPNPLLTLFANVVLPPLFVGGLFGLVFWWTHRRRSAPLPAE